MTDLQMVLIRQAWNDEVREVMLEKAVVRDRIKRGMAKVVEMNDRILAAGLAFKKATWALEEFGAAYRMMMKERREHRLWILGGSFALPLAVTIVMILKALL